MSTHVVILAISLFSSFTIALSAELDGFLDLPWRSGIEDAKKVVVPHTRARFDRLRSDANHIRLESGKFAGFKVGNFDLSFSGNHFYRAEVRFEPVSKDHGKEFAALKKLLTEKYGPPGRDEADHLESTWYFPVPGEPANLINLYADPKGTGLLVFYLSESSKTPAAGAAATPKPARTKAGAKDDL